MWNSVRVLICTDSSTELFLSFQFTKCGFAVLTAPIDPLDIQFEVIQSKPDVVILGGDIASPEIERLSKNLKKLDCKPVIYVVLPYMDRDIEHKMLWSGADGVLSMPIEAESLINDILKKLNIKEDSNVIVADYQNNLHDKITDLLRKLCITANYNGYSFLREAIKIAASESNGSRSISKSIYPRVAKAMGVSPASVERSIRTAIQKCWSNVSKEEKTEIFGAFAVQLDWKPTNSEMIYIIADYIQNDNKRHLALAT